MNKIIRACLVALLACTSVAADEAAMQEISLDDLRDKIRGGWAGQMIGVSYGAPTEFQYLEGIVPESELLVWQPDMIREALNQDDLYVDITFASVLDQYGLDATTDDFGAMFRDSEYALWHANLAARRALRRGVPATLSGTPRYNMHANDIDFQIEADFIGLMSPGLPQASNDLSFRAGRVMNHGDGIPGEYSSGIEAIAGEHFSYTDYSFNDIVDSTTTRALQLIERTGGEVTGDTATVKTQAPMAAEVEPWDDYGEPTELVLFDDERWQWTGDWQTVTQTIWKTERTSRISSQRGAAADVYLDGTLSDTIDVYPDEPVAKTNESLWHRFGLEDEEHELRIVVRGEKYGASQGSDISITRLTVFRQS